jgi:hypothetical protein
MAFKSLSSPPRHETSRVPFRREFPGKVKDTGSQVQGFNCHGLGIDKVLL